MTPEQISLIRSNFEQIASNAEAVGLSFYEHLFRINPEARGMFHGEIAAQSRKLTAMLAAVVDAIDKPWTLEVMVRELGERHVRYGVLDSHYDDVGAALIQTLHEGFGEAFDEALESAWATAYAFLAERMIEASRVASRASAA